MRVCSKPFWLAFITVFTSSVFADEQEPLAALNQALDALATAELAQSGIPSIQIAVGQSGQVVFEQGYGLSDVENQVAASHLTKYRTASVAKWWTATAAMMLNERGNLDLDAPVQQYCPTYPEKSATVTTRMLINHTSGIRHYLDYPGMIEAATDESQRQYWRLKQLTSAVSRVTRYQDMHSPLDAFKDDPLLFEPGDGWKYTSFGYRLLGCVIEGATQQSYPQAMDQLIMEAAKMSNTLPDDAWSIVPNRATGYRLERGQPLRRADLRDVSENLPAGGYLSTATDLVKFAQLFNLGLVSTETREQMTNIATDAKPDFTGQPSWRDAIPAENKYGYGVMLFSKYRTGMHGHTGRQAGGSAVVVYVPGSQTAVAVMTNTKGWNGYLSFVMKVLKAIDQSSKTANAQR